MAEEWLDLVAELLHVADERADVEYLEVVKGDLSIRFGRNGTAGGPLIAAASTPPPQSLAQAPSPTIASAAPAIAPAGAPAGAPADASGGEATAGPPPEVPGTWLVRSPMVGIFYRAPAPGEPPFTEIGAVVTSETTVGLVEAMKVFTSIRPNVDGTVEEIFGRDNEFVEFDQPLFRVRLS